MNVRFSTNQFLPLLFVVGVLTGCDSGSRVVDSNAGGAQSDANPSVVSGSVDNVSVDNEAGNEQSVSPSAPPAVTQPVTQSPVQPTTQPATQPAIQPTPVAEPISEPPIVGSTSGLNAAQQAQLPDDCLLIQNAEGVAYCFSPATRKYTAVLSDGSVVYDFNLPGDNATNSVKGLFFGPANSALDVCLVADVTVAVDNSEFEISCFEESGEFVGTVSTLGTPPRYGDPVKDEVPQGVNINDEPLLVAQAGSGRVFIAGTRYTIDPLGDPSQQDAWQRQGNFVSLINPITGRREATHRYTNRTIASLNPSNTSLNVTFNDGSEQELDLSDLGPLASSLPANRQALAPENLARALPTLFSILDGTQFEQFDNLVSRYIDTLLQRVDPADRWPDTPLCPASGPAGCEQNVRTEPLTIECSISGTATVEFGTRRSSSGSTRRTTLNTLWDFGDECKQAIDDNTTFASLTGGLETFVITTTSVPGDRSERFAIYFDFLFKNAAEEVTSVVAGRMITNEQESAREGTNIRERLADASEILGLNNVDVFNFAGGRAVVSSQGSSNFSVGNPEGFNLGVVINAPSLGLENVGVFVEPGLFTGFTRTPSGFRFSQTRGAMLLQAQDGSSATLTLSTDAPTDETPSSHTPGQEIVDYVISSDGVETRFQLDTSGFYIPTFLD